ncbi:glycosyltransferase [Chenggangzhangella methanolivorans]|uniref:glycosyltransferase n=1 Tax=Chenggangzhangella methanolivorans TaxID=1437009 RepID=UPI0032046E42
MSGSRPKVVFLGLRGLPNVQGGVETHVQALSVRLVERGWDVEVLGRAPYLPAGGPRVWKGVKVTPLWAPSARASRPSATRSSGWWRRGGSIRTSSTSTPSAPRSPRPSRARSG